MGDRSVQPQWSVELPVQQQSVLFLGARGPDGVAKFHPCKPVVRAYRACVLNAATRAELLEWGEEGDTFMTLHVFGDDLAWQVAVKKFFRHADDLPHHYLMHLAHGAEILGYKHPDERFRERWIEFYRAVCEDMHMTPETEAQMDYRLNDIFD